MFENFIAVREFAFFQKKMFEGIVLYATPTIISFATAFVCWLMKKKIELQHDVVPVSLWPSIVSGDASVQRTQKRRALLLAIFLSTLWSILVYARLQLECSNCVHNDDAGKLQALIVVSEVILFGYTVFQAQFWVIKLLGPLLTDAKYAEELMREFV